MEAIAWFGTRWLRSGRPRDRQEGTDVKEFKAFIMRGNIIDLAQVSDTSGQAGA